MYASTNFVWNLIYKYPLSLQAIYISRVVDGGIAQRDGKIQVGDKLLSVSIFFKARLKT